MSIQESERFREFFESAVAAGEAAARAIQKAMAAMTDEDVAALADRAAEFYSGAPGDPIRHMIAEVTADEYGRRFNETEEPAPSNVVIFPKDHIKPARAGIIADMAIEAAMVATTFMADAGELANAFIADVDAKLNELDDDALEIVGQINAEIFAGDTCTLDQVLLSDVVDAEFARRRATGRLLGGASDGPDIDGAA